jgi:hypothetical protein
MFPRSSDRGPIGHRQLVCTACSSWCTDGGCACATSRSAWCWSVRHVTVVKRALEEPLTLIASNAGHEGAVVVNKVRESKQPNFGFNAQAEDYTDMISAGILDPAKVTRSALQNAASSAALMLTTGGRAASFGLSATTTWPIRLNSNGCSGNCNLVASNARFVVIRAVRA